VLSLLLRLTFDNVSVRDQANYSSYVSFDRKIIVRTNRYCLCNRWRPSNLVNYSVGFVVDCIRSNYVSSSDAVTVSTLQSRVN
jgi:hypothetical protein